MCFLISILKLEVIDADGVTVANAHFLHALVNAVIAQDAVEVEDGVEGVPVRGKEVCGRRRGTRQRAGRRSAILVGKPCEPEAAAALTWALKTARCSRLVGHTYRNEPRVGYAKNGRSSIGVDREKQ